MCSIPVVRRVYSIHVGIKRVCWITVTRRVRLITVSRKLCSIKAGIRRVCCITVSRRVCSIQVSI